MYKYEMDSTRTVGATEQTRDVGWTQDRRGMDRWTDIRMDGVKPLYPPNNFFCRYKYSNDKGRTHLRLKYSEKTLHNSPVRVSYGVSIVRTLEKINCYNKTTLYFWGSRSLWRIRSDLKLTKDVSHLALTGELWDGYCEYLQQDSIVVPCCVSLCRMGNINNGAILAFDK